MRESTLQLNTFAGNLLVCCVNVFTVVVTVVIIVAIIDVIIIVITVIIVDTAVIIVITVDIIVIITNAIIDVITSSLSLSSSAISPPSLSLLLLLSSCRHHFHAFYNVIITVFVIPVGPRDGKRHPPVAFFIRFFPVKFASRLAQVDLV